MCDATWRPREHTHVRNNCYAIVMMMLYVVVYSGAKTAEKGMLGLRSTRRVANSQNDSNLESKRALLVHIFGAFCELAILSNHNRMLYMN